MSRHVRLPSKNLPFPPQTPTERSSERRTAVTLAGVSPLPGNKEIQSLGLKYKRDSEEAFIEKIRTVRQFFLKEIAPELICLGNGLSDARDVLRVAFDEDPDVNVLFNKMHQAAAQAAVLKIVRFISTYMSLTTSDAEVLLSSIVKPQEPQGKSNELQEILKALSQDKEHRDKILQEMRKLRSPQKDKREPPAKENQ